MIKHDYGVEYSISFKKVDPNDSEILSGFECEYPAIRDFAREKSINSEKDVTYIFIDNENKSVIGFCSICCTGISYSVSEISGEEKKEFDSSFPAIEIDFFAVDEKYRSIPFDKDSGRYETLSKYLFLYMIKFIENIALSVVGATHICLYAVPKAKSFYTRCDFVDFLDFMNRDEKSFVKDCIPMFYVIRNDFSKVNQNNAPNA